MTRKELHDLMIEISYQANELKEKIGEAMDTGAFPEDWMERTANETWKNLDSVDESSYSVAMRLEELEEGE